MDRIVECVPNFSTSDPIVIKEIKTAIRAVNNVKLLNVEPDVDYNRVVVTFVGAPENIGEAAFKAIAKAAELIDMTKHKGEHPRLGATDVVPFIPVQNVSIDECINIAKSVAKRVAEELEIPTYLYGKAATSEDRIKLSSIRKGEYEGLKEKIKQPDWKPDYGKAEFNEKSGATVIGVRDFLIAYNVNLDTTDESIAKEIGGIVRESGRWVEKDGERIRVPGLLKGIQGMGVSLEREDRKLTQVSMNVLNFKELTKPHEAFEKVKELAEERGVKVTGSEIVGLIPKQALIEAGKYYKPDEMDEMRLIEIAIEKLGLSDLDKFDPHKKVIELIIVQDNLADRTIYSFLDDLSSSKPAPGGGSVSALGTALSAALAAMVANLTIGKKKYVDVQDSMKKVLREATVIQDELTELINEDTNAFNAVMNAFKTPKDDPSRGDKIQKAMIYAAEVPLQVAENAFKLMDLIEIVATAGNKNAITDAGVAALFATAGIEGALFNTKINLMSIKDETIKSGLEERTNTILSSLSDKKAKIIQIVENEIS